MRIGISRETAVFFLILVLGISSRLVGLGNNSLWTDEFHTLWMAQEAKFWHEGIPGDQHPPLYYLLMQLVVQYSTDEFWLRLPSAVFGVFAFPVVWQIGVTFNRRRWGLLAMALFALAPLFVWYGRDARMYSMAAFWWTLSIYFYLRTIYRGNGLDFVGLAMCTLGGIFTAYPTLALWFVELGLFYLLWHTAGRDARRLSGWLVAQVIIVVGLWGWYPYFTVQMGRTFQFEWELGSVTASWTLGETMAFAFLVGVVALMGMVLGTAVLVRRPALQSWLKQRWTLAAWTAILLLLVVTLVGVVPRGLSIRRQLLVFLPLVIGAGAWGLIALNRRWLIGLLISVTFIGAMITAVAPPYENWKAAITFVEQHEQPGDVIIAVPGWQQLAFEYYYDGPNWLLQANDQGRMKAVNSIREGETAVFAPDQTIWVVVNSHPSVIEYSTALLQSLDTAGEQEQRADFSQNVTVLLYHVK